MEWQNSGGVLNCIDIREPSYIERPVKPPYEFTVLTFTLIYDLIEKWKNRSSVFVFDFRFKCST
jgi:hypothetical protein